MIHDPLLRIDRLRGKVARGAVISLEELDAVRSDMNCAVCFFIRLQERGAFKDHDQISEEVRLFLNSRSENSKG